MGEDGGDVVGYGVALRLPLLGHDVADIDLQGVGLPDRLHDAIHQQIGDDAGVQAAGPQDDHIRVGDGGDRLRQGLGPGGDQTHLADAAVLLLFAVKDLGLPHHRGAVLKFRLQLHVRRGHRQHPSGDGQDLAHAAHRRVKGRGDAAYSKSRGMDAESRDARLIKSILLNSASKPESWDNGGGYVDSVSANGKVYNGVFSTSQSLDLHSGAGILNAKQALAEYDNFGKTSFLGEVAKSESAFYYFDAAGENNVLNATLCWFVGSSVDGVEYDGDGNISSIDADASDFANLDLRLWAAGTDGEYELIAQSVSDYNNVEHLFINLDKSGSYALEVYFADMAYGDTESETFALAWNLAQVPEPAQSAFAASILAGALLAVSKLCGMLKSRGKSAN